MFLKLGDNIQINLDHVREVHRDADTDKERVTVYFTDGTTDKYGGYTCRDFRSLDEASAPIIPAQSGFYLMRFWFYHAEINPAAIVDDLTNREPIVAWRITSYGPVAICMETNGSPSYGEGEEAILRPDGVVDDHTQMWKNINDWADYVCTGWAKWSEKKKTDAA
jgi:hypothetical protein